MLDLIINVGIAVLIWATAIFIITLLIGMIFTFICDIVSGKEDDTDGSSKEDSRETIL